MNCDWLKETFWQYDVSIPGLDIQYNVLKCEESHQNEAHTKIS